MSDDIELPSVAQIKLLSRHADYPGNMALIMRRNPIREDQIVSAGYIPAGWTVLVTAHQVRDIIRNHVEEGNLTEPVWVSVRSAPGVYPPEPGRQLTSHAAHLVVVELSALQLEALAGKLTAAEREHSKRAAVWLSSVADDGERMADMFRPVEGD
ncbi:hypothetical protein ACFV4G_39625 [Kitasatospora sp. NPDC059747]|uniref:hypothetical protein n=1 Tax=Kitasatospora sp. NPDC059747 TaxID=3346930 RepID=UPI00366035B8